MFAFNFREQIQNCFKIQAFVLARHRELSCTTPYKQEKAVNLVFIYSSYPLGYYSKELPVYYDSNVFDVTNTYPKHSHPRSLKPQALVL
jgi:hypothetical protein